MINLNEKVYIFGAGAFGRAFASILGDRAIGFIDDKLFGNKINDLEVFSLSQVPKQANIFISALVHSSAILARLNELGYSKAFGFRQSVMSSPGLLKFLAKSCRGGGYLWLDKDVQNLNQQAICAFKSLLVDDKSLKTLNDIIKLRKELDEKDYVIPSGVEYFPDDVPFYSGADVRYVDCGAYVGDTAMALKAQGWQSKSVLCFEPSTQNLSELCKNIKALAKDKSTTYTIIPAAISSKNGVSYAKALNQSDTSGFGLNAGDINEGELVPLMRLDDVLAGYEPTHIKMDIEGAELEAIKGAKDVIAKHSPALAICLYHRSQDLWEIPLLINSINPNYNMYLRTHDEMCLGTVLYCVKKE